MDVNAKVDIGQNLTSLLERLAQQIGTTVDKVYPWYVQQAYLEGLTTLIAIAVVIPLLIVGGVACYKKSGDNWNEFNVFQPLSLALAVGAFVALLVAAREVPQSARMMLNPNFYAMKMLTTDIGRMQGR